MNKTAFKNWSLFGLAVCCVLTLNSCKDSDFDFDNIDTLLGLGGEDLNLPGNNSTKDITLDDFLELNNSNFVHIATNGDYELAMNDETPHSTTATVDRIHLVDATTVGGSISFTIPEHQGVDLSGIDIPVAEGRLASFEFAPAKVSEDINDLSYIGVDSRFTISITVPSLIRKIEQLAIKVPDYITLSDVSLAGATLTVTQDNEIILSNIPTGTTTLDARITGVKIDNIEGELGNAWFNYNNHEVALTATITGRAKINGADINTGASGETSIGGSCTIANIEVSSATGKFSPSIDFDNLGDVSLTNIPDFLTDNNVTLDLYDPHIDIDFNNELPLAGTISGRMNAVNAEGATMQSVEIPSFFMKANDRSIVSIRRQEAQSNEDTIMVNVPELSNLIRKIPSRIEFTDIHAQGSPAETTTIETGHPYPVTALYGFRCPLQFGEDAKIVYVDSMDGWNDGVKDMMFREVDNAIDGYIQIEADVSNTVPIYLTVDAWGFDLDRRDISQSDLQVTVDKTIAASPDGVTPTSTPVVIKLQPMNNDVFKRLDGLKFRLTGSARDASGSNAVTGKTLNAYNQALKITNIKVTKHGKVIYNAN